MAYQETKKTSYGQRLSGSLKGIGSGFVILIIGSILLFWNEGNFVKTKKSLQEAESALVKVTDVSNIDPALNGKLIHATAFANTQEILTDGLFGISETAIAMNRTVEYYQYKENSKTEKKDKIGGGQEEITTYTYEKVWSNSPVLSAGFHDPAYQNYNFVLTEVENKIEHAKDVSFGGYKLPNFIIRSISGNTPAEVKLTNEELQQWENIINEKMRALGITNTTAMNTEAVIDTLAAKTAAAMVHINGNMVYFGKSPSVASIGDVRVTITKVMPSDISIIAKVNGSTFEQYYAENGKTFSAVKMGTVSSENMFASAHSKNKTWTWVLRLLGIFLIIGGFKSIFSILPTLLKVLPFLGNIVEAGVGLVCTVVGGAWSLVIIAIAWLWYRPLIGIALLAVAIAGIWFLKTKAKQKKSEQN